MKFHLWLDNTAVFTTESPDETKTLGAMIGKAAYPGLAILLYGDLGMGKTQLAQGIGNALGCVRVKSPTFIIVAEHEGRLPLIHADLYRLEQKDVASLDLENYLADGCLLVVEWADRWPSPPADDRWDITLAPVGGADDLREIRITASGVRANAAFDAFVDCCGGNS